VAPLLRAYVVETPEDETYALLRPLLAQEHLTARARNELRSVETAVKYSGYLDQQRKSIEKLKRAEERTIPAWFNYKTVSGLSREMQEKLQRVCPQTLGQASRIPGVTPAALTLINVYIGIQGKQQGTAVAT
jgi:tRNA uridine 5-carboxymethylaminomethyl modification enzyme